MHAAPPSPRLVEDERRPQVIYGPQGQVIKEVGVPEQVPFGFSRVDTEKES